MSAFISTLGVAAAIVMIFAIFTVLSTIGLKNIFSCMSTKLKSMISIEKSQTMDELFKNQHSKKGCMKTISITSGTCACCGKTYIGTTEDKELPLQEVTMFNQTKVICDNCIKKMLAQWKKSGQSKDVSFSKSAEALKSLFNNSTVVTNKKEDPDKSES